MYYPCLDEIKLLTEFCAQLFHRETNTVVLQYQTLIIMRNENRSILLRYSLEITYYVQS